MQVIGLGDGTALVIPRMVAPSAVAADPEPGTLSTVTDTFAWVGEAVAAGITFDVLKDVATRLVQRGWSPSPHSASASSVTDNVSTYLTMHGYDDVLITGVRKVDGHGWSLTGIASTQEFTALADLGGDVIHVRVR